MEPSWNLLASTPSPLLTLHLGSFLLYPNPPGSPAIEAITGEWHTAGGLEATMAPSQLSRLLSCLPLLASNLPCPEAVDPGAQDPQAQGDLPPLQPMALIWPRGVFCLF